VARNTIPIISKSVSQADNKLHSIIQGYMTYIEGNYTGKSKSGPALACPAIDYTCIFKRKFKLKKIYI
jgi:hypothetical protein